MNIDLKYYSPEDAKVHYIDIWKLLCECNNDFVPSLSNRENTYQSDLLSIKNDLLPVSYFEELKSQHFILAFKENKLVAFTTFRHNYICTELEHIGISNYATTTCVNQEYRNQGIAQRLYWFLEEWIPLELKLPYITRRTWSTNLNQIHLFEKLNYFLIAELKDHRGIGISTVYYGKSITCYLGA